ncbi:MAG: phosphate ABC transporter permease subunit PstC [Pseudomonadota bacterium]
MLQSFGTLPFGWLAFALIAAASCFAFLLGRGRAEAFLTSGVQLRARPNAHGYYLAMWSAVPAAVVLLVQGVFGVDVTLSLLRGDLPDGFLALPDAEVEQYLDRVMAAAKSDSTRYAEDALFSAVADRYLELRGWVKAGALCLAGLGGAAVATLAARRIGPSLNARTEIESGIQAALFLCAAIAIATTAGIVLSLLYESLRFFSEVGVFSFLFGLNWNAQTGADFGALPLFYGTLMISFVAMCVAAPVGLFSAIYLAEYASERTRAAVKPALEVLAGIPTVVFGFFALLAVAPLVRSFAQAINGLPFVPDTLLAAQPTSALAAGLVMGVMIIPFVSSLSDDVIRAVPDTLRDGAYAVGATQAETIRGVVLPAALPGVTAALLLAVSRAIGETMIVVMAAGQRAQITADPTSDLTTITVQIVALLTGDTEFDSAKTLSAFALGLMLFLVTLGFNLIALRVVQAYREKYD